MHNRERWEGIARELLTELEDHHSDEKSRNRRDWPRDPRGMSVALRRIAPNLRAVGISVEFDKRIPGSGRRMIQLGRICDAPSDESVTSVTQASQKNLPDDPENGVCDARDACDADSRTQSGHVTAHANVAERT